MSKVIHHLFSDEHAARRRAQSRIISGLAEEASKGKIEDIRVEAILEKAEVSRSTFQKCFQGIESLFQHTAKKLADQLITEIKPLIEPSSDVAVVVAAKTRAGIRLGVSNPTLAKLALKIKWPVRDTELKILKDIKKDVQEGIKQGRFADIPPSIGVNIIFNTLTNAMQEMMLDTCPKEYETQAIYQMLVGLGVDAQSALEIASIPLSALPPLPRRGIVGKILALTDKNKRH